MSTHFSDNPMSEKQPVENSDAGDEPLVSTEASGKPVDEIGISTTPKDRAIRPLGTEEAKKLAAAAARVALDNNGQDVAVLDVSAQSAEFDFFVLRLVQVGGSCTRSVNRSMMFSKKIWAINGWGLKVTKKVAGSSLIMVVS